MKIRSSQPPTRLPTMSPAAQAPVRVAPAEAVDKLRSAFAQKSASVAPPRSASYESPLFSAPLRSRQLPPLRQALASAEIPPVSFSELEVPKSVVQVLEKSKRVLVVGHTIPDGDAIGSAVGLKRALELAGKTAVACIDDPLISGKFRKIADAGELKTAAQIQGESFDTVVIVDVADKKRIGNVGAFLEKAKNVVVLDHHLTEANHETLGLPADKPLTAWVDPTADAAAFLIGSVAARLVPESKSDAWKAIAPPLLSAMLTDTNGFSQNGVTPRALGVFKHALAAHAEGKLDQVESKVAYELPKAAQLTLDGNANKISDPATKALVTTARRDNAGIDVGGMETYALPSLRRLGHSPSPGTRVLPVPKSFSELVLKVARTSDPETNENDVKGAILDRVDETARRLRLTVLISETDTGTQVSIRSKEPGPALELAQFLGGGGHASKAAARTTEGLSAVNAKISDWIRKWDLTDQLQLRGGNI